MRTILSIVVLSILLPTFTYCQKVSLESGNLDFLTQVNKLNIEYDYDNMAVGEFEDGEDYIEEKVAEYNEKESGRGDLWEDNWLKDRITTYEPNFEKNFNNTFRNKEINITVTSDVQAKYTMIFITTFTEPGFNVGIHSKSAFINATVLFVETNNRNNIMARLIISKSIGNTSYDAEERIGAAYTVAGWKLARTIWKMQFK